MTAVSRLFSFSVELVNAPSGKLVKGKHEPGADKSKRSFKGPIPLRRNEVLVVKAMQEVHC